ncbi:MAG TPA: FHA domain-containing protein [Verrucomicrobiae bacterium]|nr:FHA domain-containing protein [Verrucomicrobiae bacterium]
MAKLVVLSEGMTGRTHELNVEKTTIGRVEDNTFQIEQPSVSSHHCEILVRGSEVVVKDLDSTNGTFINGKRITEGVLKPGQTLRLGQIDLRLENGAPASSAAPAASGAPAAAPSASPAKKAADQTVAATRGINLNEIGQGATGTAGFDTSSQGFSKKSNDTNNLIIIISVIVAVLLVVAIIVIAISVGQKP